MTASAPDVAGLVKRLRIIADENGPSECDEAAAALEELQTERERLEMALRAESWENAELRPISAALTAERAAHEATKARVEQAAKDAREYCADQDRLLGENHQRMRTAEAALERSEARAKRYEQALQLYANPENWENDSVDIGVGYLPVPDSCYCAHDAGQTARAALTADPAAGAKGDA